MAAVVGTVAPLKVAERSMGFSSAPIRAASRPRRSKSSSNSFSRCLRATRWSIIRRKYSVLKGTCLAFRL